MLTLRCGAQVWIRRVSPGDEGAIRAFIEGLGLESRRLRFFTSAINVGAIARWAAEVDAEDRVGLLAFDREGHVVGHAAYIRIYGPRAEVAVEVADDFRRHGLATALLIRLARVAEGHGISELVAEVLPENHDMLAVLHDAFRARERHVGGVVDLEFPTASWATARKRLGPDRTPTTGP